MRLPALATCPAQLRALWPMRTASYDAAIMTFPTLHILLASEETQKIRDGLSCTIRILFTVFPFHFAFRRLKRKIQYRKIIWRNLGWVVVFGGGYSLLFLLFDFAKILFTEITGLRSFEFKVVARSRLFIDHNTTIYTKLGSISNGYYFNLIALLKIKRLFAVLAAVYITTLEA